MLCPGWVNTRIVDAGRNRPTDLTNENQELSPMAQMFHDFTVEVVNGGLTPDAVATQVVDAIKKGTLYILTHPELTPGIKTRLEGLLADGTQHPEPS